MLNNNNLIIRIDKLQEDIIILRNVFKDIQVLCKELEEEELRKKQKTENIKNIDNEYINMINEETKNKIKIEELMFNNKLLEIKKEYIIEEKNKLKEKELVNIYLNNF